MEIGYSHPLFWFLASMAAIFVGLSKGGLTSIGNLSVPTLSLILSPVAAAGLLLPIYVFSDIFGFIAYRRHFNRSVLKIMVPATTIGVFIGWGTASLFSDSLIKALLGVIGLTFGTVRLLRNNIMGDEKPAGVLAGYFWGIIAGVTSFISHSGALPYQVYVLPLHLKKLVFAGTTTILFTWLNAIKLFPYWTLDQINVDNLEVAAYLCIPGFIGVVAGLGLVRIIPEKLFFQIVNWALIIISIKLLWDVGLLAVGHQ